MIIKEKVQVKEKKIVSFLHAHVGETIRVDDYDCFNTFTFTTESNCTEPEFNMKVLHTFQNDNLHGELTSEEKNAIDYAIGAIKTLADMGVLK